MLPAPSRRLLPVDALRGLAMVCVGISHISVFIQPSSPTTAAVLRWLGYFATPNFLLMSGLASGYQLARANSPRALARIVDRGLFVLLVGHFLVAGSLTLLLPPSEAFQQIVITDMIGAILCIAPVLRRLTPNASFATGAVLFVSSSIAAILWQPDTPAGGLIARFSLGIKPDENADSSWLAPMLQYFAIFIIGDGIGKLIHRYSGAAVFKQLFAGGAAAVLLAIGLNICAGLIDEPTLTAAFNIRGKHPPALAYALFYGGAGIALVGLLGMFESHVGRIPQLAAVFGRASFITYVVQQWLVDFVPLWIGFDRWLTPGPALLYLALVIAITFLIADAWDRRGANRYLTLGLKSLFHANNERMRSRSASVEGL